MKKIISIVLCAIVSVSFLSIFASCGQADTDKNYDFTIGYDNGGYGAEWLESAVNKFCAEEGIERSRVLIEAEKGYTETVASKLETSTMIRDLMITEESTQRQWAARGNIEPIDDVFEMTLKSGKKIEDVVSDGYKEMGYINNVYGEHYYLFPFTQSPGGIYYNKTLFEEQGWEVPETYSELKSLCNKIYTKCVADQPDKSKHIYPLICSADITNYWDFLVENWWVQVLGIEGFKQFCKYDTAEIFNPTSIYGSAKLSALNAFYDLVVEDTATGSERKWVINDSADYTAAQMLFCQGKAAMMPNGSWFESEMAASIPDGMEIALMPTPYLDNAQKDEHGDPIQVSFNCSANSMFIPSAAAHKDIAKKFIKFLCEPDMVAEFVSKTGTPRPIEFDAESITGLTTCQQSVLDVWKNAKGFTFITTSPLSVIGQASVWKRGYPYSSMIFKDTNGNRKTPKTYVDEEYAYCAREWNNWMSDANL